MIQTFLIILGIVVGIALIPVIIYAFCFLQMSAWLSAYDYYLKKQKENIYEQSSKN